MNTQQLTDEIMALPLRERVQLAQVLWASIDTKHIENSEREAIAAAICRDQELSTGKVIDRTHEEVMQSARRALATCDSSR